MNYVFLKVDTNEIIQPVSISFANNDFNVLTGYTASNPEITEYQKNEYKCLDESINVPGVGRLRDGDQIKINLFDKTFYTLHFGWYCTNDGLDLYGWYLVNNEVVKPFYKKYIDTVEVFQQKSC